jgi:uncharacterized protein
MGQGFFRILLYALLAYIIYKFIRVYQVLTRKNKPRRPSEQSSGIMVKDEVCNIYLPQEDALKEIVDGKTYFFCSKECRQKFLESKR